MKLICAQKPSPEFIRNVIEILNNYENYYRLLHPTKHLGLEDEDKDDDNDDDKFSLDDCMWLHKCCVSSDLMEMVVFTHKIYSDSMI